MNESEGSLPISLDILENRCIFVSKMKKWLIPVLLVALLGCATRHVTQRRHDEMKKDPALAWHKKGVALAKLGRYEEAIKEYEKVIELGPSAYGWLGKGDVLARLGRYEEALRAIDKAIELKPDFALAWHDKGNALAELGRYEESFNAFEKAEELKSQREEARKKAKELRGQAKE